MRDKINIEELFRNKLGEMEVEPSRAAWKKTSNTLRKREFFRFRPGKFNIFYVSAGMIIGTGLVIYFLGEDSVHNQRYISEQSKTILHGAPGEENGRSAYEYIGEEGTSETVKIPKTLEAEKITISPKKTRSKRESRGEDNPYTGSPADLEESDSEVAFNLESESRTEQGQISTLISHFTASRYEGCVPLHVTFLNTSYNAVGYTWNFGAPGKESVSTSSREPMEYCFNEAGNYTVTLSCTSPEGLERSYSEIITVHPVPRAEFEVSEQNIYNYSVDAVEFIWFLLSPGTGGNTAKEFSSEMEEQKKIISTDFQPFLTSFPVPDNDPHYLGLVVMNSFGCTDTAVNLLPGSVAQELVFPTAFSPNPNGSTGGYYNPKDPENRIFHPNFTEEPLTYHLKIFNKAGEFIFESADILRGWDGYIQETPAARGVYIFQCTGTWKNGEQFNYRGDITILWNN